MFGRGDVLRSRCMSAAIPRRSSPTFARTEADALELDYKTDVRLAHDLMKDSTVFIGNLDPSSVVALGTPALVEARSRELIALFGDTCRFILNGGCAIPATAPDANIRAIVHAARSW